MRTSFLLFFLIVNATFISAQIPAVDADVREANRLSSEAVKLFAAKKYDDAFTLAQRTLVLRESSLGKNHIETANAWRNLAFIQIARAKQKDAEKAFNNALGIYEKNLPLTAKDERAYVEMLEAVAAYEAGDADLIGAEKKYLLALELREKISGKNAMGTFGTLSQLGRIYQIQDLHEKAYAMLLRALEVKAANNETIDASTQELYDITSCSLTKLGRGEEVQKLRERFFKKYDEMVEKAPLGKQSNSIEGGVLNGKARMLAKPTYPSEARAAGASGTVIVQALIDESGKIVFACAISGPKELYRASEMSAYQSKFSPTILSGRPVRVTGVITYNYVR